ncbi:MAG TPA: hypothetical protein VJ750_01335 [Rhizomicrobium sp.]|nr:hypothetical protein [Rhizomicrobium sp.]
MNHLSRLTSGLDWDFFAGSLSLSFGIVAVLGLANALAILLAYELAIRDLRSEWIAGGDGAA